MRPPRLSWRYQLVCSACRTVHADCRSRESAAFALAVRSLCIDCEAPLVIIAVDRKDDC